MPNQPGQPQQIQVNTADELSRGRYSNSMFVTHSPEEFILDWLLTSPSGTFLVSRVVVSPGHIKRIIAALSDNLKKYEQNIGQVKSIEPSQQKFN
jgi:hypothetical protein